MSVPYSRDCSDTNCSGASLPPLVLSFTPEPSLRLEFTPDGGLLAFGSVPAQNLTFGYTGTPDQFAHRTSDVEAGAYHMPGTFLAAMSQRLPMPFVPQCSSSLVSAMRQIRTTWNAPAPAPTRMASRTTRV